MIKHKGDVLSSREMSLMYHRNMAHCGSAQFSSRIGKAGAEVTRVNAGNRVLALYRAYLHRDVCAVTLVRANRFRDKVSVSMCTMGKFRPVAGLTIPHWRPTRTWT